MRKKMEKEKRFIHSLIHSFIQHYGWVLRPHVCTCQPPRRQLLWCLVGGLAGRPSTQKTKTDLMLPFVLRGQPPTISSALSIELEVGRSSNRTPPLPPSPLMHGQWELEIN